MLTLTAHFDCISSYNHCKHIQYFLFFSLFAAIRTQRVKYKPWNTKNRVLLFLVCVDKFHNTWAIWSIFMWFRFSCNSLRDGTFWKNTVCAVYILQKHSTLKCYYWTLSEPPFLRKLILFHRSGELREETLSGINSHEHKKSGTALLEKCNVRKIKIFHCAAQKSN